MKTGLQMQSSQCCFPIWPNPWDSTRPAHLSQEVRQEVCTEENADEENVDEEVEDENGEEVFEEEVSEEEGNMKRKG